MLGNNERIFELTLKPKDTTMKKLLSLAAVAAVGLSMSACSGSSADNTIYVEDWGSTAEQSYNSTSRVKSSVRAKRAERLYNRSLRK